MVCRRLSLESLESRRVMAGNVTASIVEGELRILGDSSSNWIEIHQIAGADGKGKTFVIDGKKFDGTFDDQGQPIAGDRHTRINGGLEDVVLTTRLDTIRIYLKDGNDVVKIGTSETTGNARTLVIHTGDGHDFASLERFTVYGGAQPLTIRTGIDDDPSPDTVELNSVSVTQQGLVIAAGQGNDHVSLQNVSVAQFTDIDLGGGADRLVGDSSTLGSTAIHGGSSNHRDVVTLSNCTFAWLTVSLQDGDDLLHLRERVTVTNRLTLNGGDGIDELRIGEQIELNKVTKISIEINS